MSETVRIRATASYPYGPLSLKPGDEFDATIKDADLLKKIGRATDVPVASDEPPQKRKARTPRRKVVETVEHE